MNVCQGNFIASLLVYPKDILHSHHHANKCTDCMSFCLIADDRGCAKFGIRVG